MNGRQMRAGTLRLPIVLCALVALAASPVVATASAEEPASLDDGRDDTIACQDFRLGIQTYLGDAVIQDRSDEGWVWVDGARRFREVTGVATRAWYSLDGIGHARADLFDRDGFVGTCTASLLVDEIAAPY